MIFINLIPIRSGQESTTKQKHTLPHTRKRESGTQTQTPSNAKTRTQNKHPDALRRDNANAEQTPNGPQTRQRERRTKRQTPSTAKTRKQIKKGHVNISHNRMK